jgi:hypothetical protein
MSKQARLPNYTGDARDWMPSLGIRIGAEIVSAIVSTTVGAVLLTILRVVRRSGR